MIYLDNAATTFPKPLSVTNAVNNCLKNYSANPGRGGHALSVKASEQVFNCRTKVKNFFGAESEENVIFTPNCTTSINIVLKGTLKRGDHVICSSMEHNAVTRPLNKLKNDGIIDFDIAHIFPGDDDATLNSFEGLIRYNTKMIVCTHASNVFGTVMPIKKIGRLCSEYGILFTVDAAQSAGVLPINVKDMCIDYLCVAPHKGLYAPMGTGILIANKEIPNTIIEGGTGSMSMLIQQPDFMPDKFESGTLNLPGIVGISSGIDFVNSRKTEHIYGEELKLISYLYNKLKNMSNIILYSEHPDFYKSVPLLSFNVKGKTSEEIGAFLDKQGIAIRPGLHCAPLAHKMFGTAPEGTVRICPSVFSRISDIDRLIFSLKKV